MSEVIELGKKLVGLRENQKKRFEEYKTADKDAKPGIAKAIKDAEVELGEIHDKWTAERAVEQSMKANDEELKALKESAKGGVPFEEGDQRAEAKTEDEAKRESTLPKGFKSLGQFFTDSEAFKAHKGETRPHFSVDVNGVTLSSIKAVLSTSAGISPYPPQQADVVPIARQRPTIADLMPSVDTDAPSIIYLEQTLATNGADTVAEGATKPQSAFEWTRRTVPLEVIAHLLPITNQELEDIPSVRSIIDQELVMLLKLAEESQILNGTGTSPDIQGLLTKTGVQTQAKGADDLFTSAMKAYTKVRYTGFADVTAGVMHPNNWLTIVTTQDSIGRFIYGDPSQSVTPRLWGVPVIVTTAMTEDTGLFGDFQLYARLWRKGGIRVETGFVNDDFAKNQQTLRCEERVTLQIRRPSAFVKWGLGA